MLCHSGATAKDASNSARHPGSHHLCRALLAYLNPPRQPGDETHRDTQRLSALWQNVRTNPAYGWSTKSLADESGCLTGHLHRICLARYKTTPMRMVRDIRLEQAAHLPATDWPLAEIASLIGFATTPAFSDAA